MQFYYVRDDYINFLRQYDDKVFINKKEGRPYIGIVIRIDNISYYAPLSSPKPKHLKMKNTVDFRKISDGLLGAINLNNMIPVPDEAVMEVVFKKIDDSKYKNLLLNQYYSIKDEWNIIRNLASSLRDLLLKKEELLTKNEKLIKNRCCNLSLLESVYNNYRK